MKKVLLLLAVALVAYLAWGYLKPPTLDGPDVPEADRVFFMEASGSVSVADHLQKDRWTLFLFIDEGAADSDAIERRIETTVRQRVKNVRLVIVDVGGVGSAAAKGAQLTRLPSARLYDGYRQRLTDLEEILELLGA